MSKSPFDLNDLVPDYFNKKVFRSIVLIIFFLFLFTAWSNDWKNEFPHVYCPEESYTPCTIERNKITNNKYIPEEWDGVVLAQGEFIGEKPNEHYFLFKKRVWLLIILGFSYNHFLYVLKNKKFFPELKKGGGNK